jgi:hypothetical protein
VVEFDEQLELAAWRRLRSRGVMPKDAEWYFWMSAHRALAIALFGWLP